MRIFKRRSKTSTSFTADLTPHLQPRAKIAPYKPSLKRCAIRLKRRWIAKPRMCCAFCARARRRWPATSLFKTTSPLQGTLRIRRMQPARATTVPTAARTAQTAAPQAAPKPGRPGRPRPGTPLTAHLRLAARAVTRAGISAKTACRQTARLCRPRTTRLRSREGLAPQIQRIRPRVPLRSSIHWLQLQPSEAEPR